MCGEARVERRTALREEQEESEQAADDENVSTSVIRDDGEERSEDNREWSVETGKRPIKQ